MTVRIAGAVTAVAAITVIGVLSSTLVVARSDIGELRADNAQLASDLAAASETIGRLDHDLTIAAGEIAALSQTKGDLESDLAGAERVIAGLTADKMQLESYLAANRETIGELRQDKATLESNLTTANEEIVALTSSLARFERQLDAAERDIAVLAADKTKLATELAADRETIGELRQDKATLESNLASVKEENLTLANDRDALSANLESVNAAREQIASELRTALAANETLHAEKESVNAAREQIASELRTALATNETLRAEKETVERMYGQIDELRREISDLQRQREPLILETQRSNPLCTGSMEPKLTCLDETVTLTNFQPEDIVVGSIIVFNPTAECNLRLGGRTLHRVMDVKVEDGTYYYWPQGDNNPEPDGCWIPDSNVLSYLIDIHKDVRPENAELRQKVLDAFAEWDAAEVAYNKAWQDYEDYCDQWDTRTNPTRCMLPVGHKYRWGLYLYEKAVAAYEYMGDLSDYVDCWVDVAANVIYLDGEPIYPPCLPPFPRFVLPPSP